MSAVCDAGGEINIESIAEGNLDLREESLTAYEAAYAGAFGAVTLGAAVFLNDARDQIYFTQDGCSSRGSRRCHCGSPM